MAPGNLTSRAQPELAPATTVINYFVVVCRSREEGGRVREELIRGLGGTKNSKQ